MTEEKTYTEQELQHKIQEALQERAQVDFQDKTKRVLEVISRRLDAANGYKETMGKDIKDLQNYVREQDEKRIERERERKESHAWWQDSWIRVGIAFGVLWEIINIAQAIGLLHSIHLR